MKRRSGSKNKKNITECRFMFTTRKKRAIWCFGDFWNHPLRPWILRILADLSLLHFLALTCRIFKSVNVSWYTMKNILKTLVRSAVFSLHWLVGTLCGVLLSRLRIYFPASKENFSEIVRIFYTIQELCCIVLQVIFTKIIPQWGRKETVPEYSSRLTKNSHEYPWRYWCDGGISQRWHVSTKIGHELLSKRTLALRRLFFTAEKGRTSLRFFYDIWDGRSTIINEWKCGVLPVLAMAAKSKSGGIFFSHGSVLH